MVHPLSGQPAPRSLLANIPRLVSAYYTGRPDPQQASQRVAFGTSGHRGCATDDAFNEAHLLAIAMAVYEYRSTHGIDGPLFIGLDTHALSEPARRTVVEVLAAHGVELRLDAADGYTPTPAVSVAIVEHNRGRTSGLADGLVVTPSHNPPEDGGIKYNPPHGGPAGHEVTDWIQRRANEWLVTGVDTIKRISWARALAAETTRPYDFMLPYVRGLSEVIDLEAIRGAGLRLGVDPMGGSGVAYWGPIAEIYGLNIDVVNEVIDPTFAFMTVDKDGKIRMDCSSPYAMARLVKLKNRYDLAFGNDTDYDRHGIVTPSAGLLNPNHYLAVAIEYLFGHRPQWSSEAAIGKTLVSSSMIDRVAAELHRPLAEVPVGFKWFVEGLGSGRYAFGGEESAGASFLRMSGLSWSTDKDGIIMDLLAAEIMATTGRDPGERYQALTERFGAPVYERLDAPASPEQKAVLKSLSASQVPGQTLAGEPIEAKLTTAPGNGAAIGGVKVVTRNGWFAARPSGTENVYKIYTESFLGNDHLARIQAEARTIVSQALAAAGV